MISKAALRTRAGELRSDEDGIGSPCDDSAPDACGGPQGPRGGREIPEMDRAGKIFIAYELVLVRLLSKRGARNMQNVSNMLASVIYIRLPFSSLY